MALLNHQLHIPLPAKPAAGLSQLHIIWRIFTHQHVHKTVRQPLQFGTTSDVANNRYHNEMGEGEISRLYTCVMDDTEVSSMIVKNSEASNSYCGVADRRWLLPAISDKQQKRPISTLTTDHKTYGVPLVEKGALVQAG